MAKPFSTSPHDPVKSAELFNVVQFFRGSGGHEYLARNIPAQAAVDLLFDRKNTVGARSGFVERIIITDAFDAVCAEWRYGFGVSFPS
jgi:hypothetical protein